MSLECKGCLLRKVGCHAVCEDNLERERKNKEKRLKRRQEKYLDGITYDLSHHRQKTRRSI